jgi:hypothetical protein
MEWSFLPSGRILVQRLVAGSAQAGIFAIGISTQGELGYAGYILNAEQGHAHSASTEVPL